MIENSTILISSIISSSLSSNLASSTPVDRTRTMVSAIYIAGIAFMVGVFLLLLWVNLFNRYCGCWHDTSIINRFNRQWLIRQTMAGDTNSSSSSKNRQQRIPSNENELE